jgi:alcohol/geraniol dehydrogenase (NADP+)
VDVGLDWIAYANALLPKGRLHFVGMLGTPIQMASFPLIIGQRSISGSPVGSPATSKKMIEFAARHSIEPIAEFYDFSQVNEALACLEAGNARYRIVLKII